MQTRSPTRKAKIPSISVKPSPEDPIAESSTIARGGQRIYIRVLRSLVMETTTAPTSPPPSNHLYLIEGSFEDIARFAGTTVDWIIKIAHLICSPSIQDAGQVYTHTTGTSLEWYSREREPSWRQVVLGDPLLPGIYEFHANFPIVISQLSARQSHSVITKDSEPNATRFRERLITRDGGVCVVTSNLIASRLLPKRMGKEGVKAVMTTFAPLEPATDDIYDPTLGLLLISGVDKRVDKYEVGFYRSTASKFIYQSCHSIQPLYRVGHTLFIIMMFRCRMYR